MKRRRNRSLVSCFSLLLILSAHSFGQSPIEGLCAKSFELTAMALLPVRTYRKDVFSSSCDYQALDKRNTSVLLSVELFGDNSTALEQFRREIHENEAKSRIQQTFNKSSDDFWEQIAYYPSRRKYDSFLLLVKGRVLIYLSSESRSVLVKVEARLRELDFSVPMLRGG